MRLICGTESATPRESVEDCGRADVCDSGVARDAGRRKQRYRVCFSDDKQKGTKVKSKTTKKAGYAPVVKWQKRTRAFGKVT